MIGADSNNVEPRLYDHIRATTGDIDAMFIGMECDGGPLSWLYGPLLTRPLTKTDGPVAKAERLQLREGNRHRRTAAADRGLRICDGTGALAELPDIDSIR